MDFLSGSSSAILLKLVDDRIDHRIQVTLSKRSSESNVSQKQNSEDSGWLKRTSAAKYLDVSLSTLDRWSREHKGRKPSLNKYYGPDGQVRFKKSELDKIFKKE